MKKGARLLKGMQMGALALVVIFGLLTIIATDDSDEVVQRIKDLIAYTGKTTPVQFTETNAREVVEGALGFRVLDGHGTAAAGDSRAESVLQTLLSQRPVAEMLLLVNQYLSGLDFDLNVQTGTRPAGVDIPVPGPWAGDLYIERVSQGSQQLLIFKFRQFSWYGFSLEGDIETLLAVNNLDPEQLITETLVTFSCGGASEQAGCSGFAFSFPGHPEIYLLGSAAVDITSNIVETDGLLDFDMTLVKDFDTLPVGYDPLVVCTYAGGCYSSAPAQNGMVTQYGLTGGGTTTIVYNGPARISLPTDDNLTSAVTMGLAGSYDVNTTVLDNMTTTMAADPEALVVSGAFDFDLTYDHTGFTLAKTFTQFVLQHLDLYFHGDGSLTMTGEFDQGLRPAGGTPYHKIIAAVFKDFTWSVDPLGEREYLLNGGLEMDYKQYDGMISLLDEPWEVWLQDLLRHSETTFTIDDMTVSSPFVSLSFDGTKTLTMMSDTAFGDGWDALLPAHITGDMLVRNNLADPPETFWFKDYEVVVSLESQRQQAGESMPATGSYFYYADANGTFYDPAWGVVDFTTDGTDPTGRCPEVVPAAIGIPEYSITPDRGLIYYRGLLPTGQDFFSSAYIGANCCGTYDIRVDVEGNCTYAAPSEWQNLDWDDLFWNLFGGTPDMLNR